MVEKKKLAPLNDGGPTQLLNLQIQKLEQENQGLRQRMKTVRPLVRLCLSSFHFLLQIESQATEILESKLELKAEVESLKIQKTIEVETEIKTGENTKEFEKVRSCL